ncbi:MAG: ABC-F family ATP-binding cassette domain-containing protein [Hyphomicrobiales bacterium]
MALPPVLHLKDIRLSFGGKPLLEGAELKVEPGDRICLVGRNGSGKSTLLRIAAGEIEPDHGERLVKPGTTIRYLPQEPDLSAYPTTLAYVEGGLAPGDDAHRAQYLLNELGLSGEESPASLSGGEARRAALARVMAPEPDVLLLDEPTNHLDLPVIEWLEGELKSMRGALVVISHDRRFLENLSRATVWIDRGIARRLEQGFAAFEGWRDEVLEQEEIERHKLNRAIVREEHWVRYGVTARRKRNQRRMRELEGLRKERRDARRATGSVTFKVNEADTSGKLVVEAERISKAFDDRPIVKDFSTRILRGDRVAFVGPNGAGKTTLVSLLTGRLGPDTGRVRLGVGLDVMTIDQTRSTLDGALTLKETLTGGGSDTLLVAGKPRHVMSYLKDFLFPPEQANTPVGALSGGERGRLALAKGLLLPSNVMVLDEPTNDLDLETLDLLQEMITDYPGTVLIVSHDRDFIDRTATSVIASAGDGKWIEYAGGFSDMLAQRKLGNEAALVRPRAERKEEAAAASSAAAASTPAPAAGKRKLSFKEKHALETLPKRMAHLEAEIARLHGVLADAGLYARDPGAFAKATAALDAAKGSLAEAEDEWLRLEMLKEELSISS